MNFSRNLLGFICLICALQLGEVILFDDNGVVNTLHTYVFIGENLTMTCNLTAPTVYYNASDMYFRRKYGEILPKKYIHTLSSKSIQLRMPVTSTEDEGNYVCWLNGTKRMNTSLGNDFIKVDYTPVPVQNISCVVHNWFTMNCSWSLAQNYIHEEYLDVILTWAVSSDQYECKNIHKTYCLWSQNDSATPFFPDNMYSMVVTVRNNRRNKEVSSSLIKINSSKIVKPAPVTSFHVVSRNSTCFHLKWDHSSQHRPKMFMVQYQSYEMGGKPGWQVVNHPNEWGPKMEMVLCGLTPFSRYEVRICVLPLVEGDVHGFASDWVSVVNRTLDAVPAAAPRLSSGSYTEQPCQDGSECRFVIIYWQPIDENEARSDLQGYTLELLNLDSQERETHTYSKTAKLAELKLENKNNYEARLFSHSKLGLSTWYARIVIPQSSTKPEAVQNFVVETDASSLNSPRFFLSWKSPKDDFHLIGYTVYWCFGDKITLHCLEPIKWQQLKPTQHKYEVDITSVNGLSNYLMGISAEKYSLQNLETSSGITWGKCVFTKGRKPERSPKNVHFSDHQLDRTLRVEWEHYDCAEVQSFVTAYLIQYCVVNSKNGCSGPLFNITVDNDRVNHVIKNLEPEVSYGVVMRLKSRSGIGPASSMMVKRVHDSSLKTGDLVGIGFAALFVMIIILFSTCIIIRKIRRKAKEGLFLQVQYPPSLTEQHKTMKQYHHTYEKVPNEKRKDGRDSSITSESSLINHMEPTDSFPNSGTYPGYKGSDDRKPQGKPSSVPGKYSTSSQPKHYPSSNTASVTSYVKAGQESDSSCNSYCKIDSGNSSGSSHESERSNGNNHSGGNGGQGPENFVPVVRLNNVLSNVLDYRTQDSLPNNGRVTNDCDANTLVCDRRGICQRHQQQFGNLDYAIPVDVLPGNSSVPPPPLPTSSSLNLQVAQNHPQPGGTPITRPLSDYMYSLPPEYFQDPPDNPGPTTDL